MGQLQKLDTISAALKFMRLFSIDKKIEEETEAKVERMLQFITHHRKSYKVEKIQSEKVRLEELVADGPDLSDIDQIITNLSLTKQLTQQPTR